MKTKIITLTTILAMVIAMFSTAIMAASTSEVNTADAMNELGLFKGISETDYALDAPLTRIQGVVMVIRMLGKEVEANSGKYINNTFHDVDDWADGYVAYAYDTGITKGVSEADGIFGTDNAMYDYMFITFTLRALGYTEENSGYVWDNPFMAANNLGMIDYTETDKEFTRAEAVSIFWNAFEVKLYGEEITLAEKLISEGIFTEAEYASAKATQANGRTENVGVPLKPETDAPETDAPETDAPETDAPETDAPETDAPETDAPETDAPETDVPETDAPETDAPETDAPETDAPETDAPTYTRGPNEVPDDEEF